MKNVVTKVEGNILTITVDLSKRFGASSTGKTIIVATTEGAVKLDGKHATVSVGLNVWTKEGRQL